MTASTWVDKQKKKSTFPYQKRPQRHVKLKLNKRRLDCYQKIAKIMIAEDIILIVLLSESKLVGHSSAKYSYISIFETEKNNKTNKI